MAWIEDLSLSDQCIQRLLAQTGNFQVAVKCQSTKVVATKSSESAVRTKRKVDKQEKALVKMQISWWALNSILND